VESFCPVQSNYFRSKNDQQMTRQQVCNYVNTLAYVNYRVSHLLTYLLTNANREIYWKGLTAVNLRWRTLVKIMLYYYCVVLLIAGNFTPSLDRPKEWIHWIAYSVYEGKVYSGRAYTKYILI